MEGNQKEEGTGIPIGIGPMASASDEESLITSFIEITSCSQQEALFFLESHNFHLDSAVSTFFESTTTTTSIVAVPTTTDDPDFASPSASLSPSPTRSRSRSRSPPSGPSSQYNLRSRTRAGVAGVRNLADLHPNSDDDADADADAYADASASDDDHPHYYTGGQKSGMVVEDPSKGNDVEAIFEQTRRRAVQSPVDQPSSSSRSFSGPARLLSGELISSSPLDQAPQIVTHTITLWRNGFTVDDGPLRRFDDEENAPMLESIKNSECPKELQPADKKTAVHVNLVRRDENYHEPKKPRQKTAFKGVGRTLGTSSSTSSEPSSDATAMNSAPPPVMGLVVDDKLPSTSIQLRLADGTRMVSRFNYHHTIRDIHAFIDASRPARVGAYTLQIMGFPPKPLTDIDQTIEEAGLANSVVIQKF